MPFKDGQFDLVTISFGLRNTQDTEKALAEMLRVTKPGGEIVICEFSSPTFGPFRTIYTNYLMRALPAIASIDFLNCGTSHQKTRSPSMALIVV